MLNKVILMGRLCADPDFRQTPSGVAVCRIRLAIDRRFTNKQTGEREADFINVSCWRQQAEFVSRYFHKGSMIIVEGSLQNNDYTDQNGVKHYSMEVLADNVTFGESKRSAQENGGGLLHSPHRHISSRQHSLHRRLRQRTTHRVRCSWAIWVTLKKF